jgi:hypothetical protein
MRTRPSTMPFNRTEPGQYTDHGFLLAINQAAQRSTPQHGFPNACLVNDGFENGARFGIE